MDCPQKRVHYDEEEEEEEEVVKTSQGVRVFHFTQFFLLILELYWVEKKT